MEDIPKYLRFPRCFKPRRWANYLERHLTREEHIILQDLGFEIGMNHTIKELQQVCVGFNLKVGMLTNLHGNCLFESLIYHKIGENVESLRVGIASIMHIFRKKQNFFPGQQDTVEDLFVPFNEIGYAKGNTPIKVGDKTHWEECYYKYDFNVMLQELSNQYCWDALPTQLILMLISFLYKANIIVIHSNGHKTNINMYESMENPPEIKNIYLGLLGESHYIPVDELSGDDDINPPQYDEALAKFTKWARDKEHEIINKWVIEQHNKKKDEEKKDGKDLDVAQIAPVESQFVSFSETVGEDFNPNLDLGVSF